MRLRRVLLGTAALALAGGLAMAAFVLPSGATLRPDLAATPPAAAPPTTGTTGPLGAAVGGRVCSAALLADLRNRAGANLAARVQQLQRDQQSVTGSTLLTPSDRATLTTDLANELAGITALSTKVPSDATCAAVLVDARSMVTDYRVYLVMTPQVHLSVAADSEAAVAAQLAALEPRVAGEIAAFTPASYPACWSSFLGDRTQLETGSAALRLAAKDLRTIVRDFKIDKARATAATGSSTSTTTAPDPPT
jgi:hypothetical protein